MLILLYVLDTIPLSSSPFVPTMNCLSPLGNANLLSMIGLSKGPRHTGKACPFEKLWRSVLVVARSGGASPVRALAARFCVPTISLGLL